MFNSYSSLSALSREVIRNMIILLIGFLFIFGGTPFAVLVNEPSFAPWGLFLGGTFITAALSHVLRRMVFPYIEVQKLMKMVDTEQSTPAAIVFLGICIILAAFIITSGSMLRI